MSGIGTLKRKWDLLGYQKQRGHLQELFGFHMSEDEHLEVGYGIRSLLKTNDEVKIIEGVFKRLGNKDLAKAYVFLGLVGFNSQW